MLKMKDDVATNIPRSMFRAYDIRGIVEPGGLTPDTTEIIGRAIGSELRTLNRESVIVGRDGRLSSPDLSRALIAGLNASGCDVIDIGMVPTPVLYFATKVLASDSGIMITGSHNPVNYNGLKIVLGGETLAGDRIQAIYDRIVQGRFDSGDGTTRETDITGHYVTNILERIHLARPMKIVIDCGNGVAGELAPLLFDELGCDVHRLYCEVDGHFPNHHPDPTEPENLQDLIKAVQQHSADIGLAFDGDGDRLGVISGDGQIIWADRLMMLFSRELLSRVKNVPIIFDVKCSNNLPDVIRKSGGIPVMSRTGHSFIKAKMREIDAPLAGEMSGHLFFRDGWFGFDDALYAGARLLGILSIETRKPSEVLDELPNNVSTPEIRQPVAEEAKKGLMEKLLQDETLADGERTTIDGLRVDFGYGWGLVRPSNTTANLILRFEADTQEHLEHIEGLFRTALLKADNGLQVPF